MPYLFTLPGLLCGLALSIEDVRHRRVPIAWVAAGRVASAGRRFRVWSGGERPVRAVAGAVVHRAMLPDPVRVGVAGASVIGIRRCDRLDTYGIVCRTVWPVACGGLVAGDGRCRHHMDCLVDAIRPTTAHHRAHAGKVPYVPVILAGAIVAVAVGASIPVLTSLSPLCGQLPSARGANEVTTGFRLATCVVRPRSGHVHRRLRRNLVSPVSRLTVQKYSQLPPSGCSAA